MGIHLRIQRIEIGRILGTGRDLLYSGDELEIKCVNVSLNLWKRFHLPRQKSCMPTLDLDNIKEWMHGWTQEMLDALGRRDFTNNALLQTNSRRLPHLSFTCSLAQMK